MFGLKQKIDTDEAKIDEILSRSISQIYPSKEAMKKELMSGRRLRIYTGADATGKDLHLGHSTNFIFLEKLRKLGHEVIVLFGDFTARIGDPSDKTAARVRLTKKEVNENLKTWKKQLSKLISFNGTNPAKVVRNSTWLSKINFGELIELSANFTVQQMIERDMFQKRLQDAKPIYLHEFYYPLMQGYDSVEMNVDLEIGGNDQTFNMLAGRILQRKINQKEKFVISTTLLENPVTGKKLMSKSEGNYVSLQDSPDDMFGKIMALPDEVIIPLFIDATFKSTKEINELSRDLGEGKINPMDTKKQLAREIVTLYHSEKEAEKSAENFNRTFSKGEIPEGVLEVEVQPDSLLQDVVIENDLVTSKSDWKRLIEQGGVTEMENNKKIKEINFKLIDTATFRIGKKRFIRIKVGK